METPAARSLPITAVIATRDRAAAFSRTLASVAAQDAQPARIVVIDASSDDATRALCAGPPAGLASTVCWFRATRPGAASQRNEGVALAGTPPTIWFLDDDILLEPNCLARLHATLASDPELGGVNAQIVNQRYDPPGLGRRMLYRFLRGRREQSYAGCLLGPGLNLLPADSPGLPAVVPVEWLNTTCTLYRHAALPDPPFPEHFTGYSLGEDVALSAAVARQGWKLANARTARIFHDSQPSKDKNDVETLARMETINRRYIMTEVLGRSGAADYLKLAVLEGFSVLTLAHTRPARLPALLRGKVAGWRAVRG